jgi:hypothetical protein
VFITVDLSIESATDNPGDKDPPVDDDDENPADDDDEDDEDGKEGNMDDPFWDPPGPIGPVDLDLLQWLIFIVLVFAIVSTASFLLLKNRRGMFRKRTGKINFRLPSIYTGIHAGGRVSEPVMETGRGMKPVVVRTTREVGGDRERLIMHYLDMIESSPEEFGITRSMTPREVSSRLIQNGLDEDLAIRVSSDFEYSIYRLGRPEKKTLERFDRDKGTVKGWFSAFIRKIGMGSVTSTEGTP